MSNILSFQVELKEVIIQAGFASNPYRVFVENLYFETVNELYQQTCLLFGGRALFSHS